MQMLCINELKWNTGYERKLLYFLPYAFAFYAIIFKNRSNDKTSFTVSPNQYSFLSLTSYYKRQASDNPVWLLSTPNLYFLIIT